MGRASKLFYLAVFAFLSPAHADSYELKEKGHSADDCAIHPKATVSDTCATFSTLDQLNERISPVLKSITQETDFFSYYRLNLFNRACPFWSDDTGMCGNIACAVSTLDSEEDIPPIWRAEELSKLEGPKAGHPGKKQQQERPKEKPLQGMLGEDVGETCVVEYDDECDERDYCVPEDEGATAKGDYVSLLDNPERFTGYSGPGARLVWDAIYRENCFSKPLEADLQQSPNPLRLSGLRAAKDLRNVLERHERAQVVSSAAGEQPYPLDNECLEKRVFYRLVSGMHASISTHLCWDYFNQTTGEWLPNVQCYKDRLHNHPERLSNLYFDFAVLVRAVSKLQKHLHGYAYCLDDPAQNADTKKKVDRLTDIVAAQPQIFDETIMFQDDVANGLKEDFRNRFRNVSRLMDCIGCDKCRLWGKLQTAGYGAALKVLFEFDETKNGENPPLRRTELVALINTLGRVSNSLSAVQKFERAIQSGTEHELPVHTTVPRKPSGLAEDFSSVQQQSDERNESNEGVVKQEQRSDDEDLFPDYENEADDANERPHMEYGSISQAFWEEIDLVVKTYKWVFMTWAKIPKTLFEIVILELNRLWNFWLGLPVAPRSWEFRFPTRDEL
ncbi:hypothetical protein VTO42DRAFT_805 [Malbranchea cinnamomea]